MRNTRIKAEMSMKAAEYLLKLQENELFPFSKREQQLAIDLAKQYTGSLVLREWLEWKKKSNDGFSLFALALPQLIREYEERVPEKFRDDPRNRVSGGSNPFDQVWSACRKKPACVSRKVEEPVIENTEDDQFANWERDEVLGWHIGGVPIF